MGLLLTILFIVLSYLSPADLLPALAPYRLLLWVAVLAALASLPNITIHNIRVGGKPALFVMGLMCAIPLSRAANRWLGGAFSSVYEFGITAAVFFFVLCNTYSLPRIRRVVLVLVLCCLYLVAQGAAAFHLGYRTDVLLLTRVGDVSVPARMRATGWLGDPNDLAQQLTVMMPFLGLAWRKRSAIRNLVLVILPGLALAYGVYLTGSRGGLMGIAAVSFFALRDRVKAITAAAISGVAVLGLLAISFGGGRGISASKGSGASRLVLWGDGISMFKSHPVFGVGYGAFTEYSRQTAHNSFVLAFSELGFFGYFFWIGVLVFCLAQVGRIVKHASKDPADIEIQRWAKATRIAFATFLVTGWFLSRAYTSTLYILAALMTSLYELYRKNHPELTVEESAAVGRRLMAVFAFEIVSMGLVYIMVRARGL